MPPLPKPRLTTEATDLLESLERRARFVQEDLIPQLNNLASTSQSKEKGTSSPATGLHGHQRLSDDIREELGVLARDLDVSCLPHQESRSERIDEGLAVCQQLEMMVDDQSGIAARKELNAIVEGWATRLHECVRLSLLQTFISSHLNDNLSTCLHSFRRQTGCTWKQTKNQTKCDAPTPACARHLAAPSLPPNEHWMHKRLPQTALNSSRVPEHLD